MDEWKYILGETDELNRILESAADCVVNCDLQKLGSLIDSSYPLNVLLESGETLLTMACSLGRFDVVWLLLVRGANPDARNLFGATPLSIAVQVGDSELVQLLTQLPIDVDAELGQGMTAYMLAMLNGRIGIAQHLLACGADPLLVNDRGLTGEELYKEN